MRRLRRFRRLRRGLLAALIVLSFVLLLGGLYVGARIFAGPSAAKPWREAGAELIAKSASLGFALRHVDVEGRHWTKPSEIMQALAARSGMPIFAIDLGRAQRRLETLPWVRKAVIERRLPATIFVRLEERRPLSLWQHRGRIVLIDRSGTVIPLKRLGRFAKLPLVVGADAPRHAARLLHMLAREPRLAARVSAAILVADRRWNLRLDNAIEVLLPGKDAASAWVELARIERSQKLLERDVSVIDMRLPGRIVVRVNPAPAKGAPATKEGAAARKT